MGWKRKRWIPDQWACHKQDATHIVWNSEMPTCNYKVPFCHSTLHVILSFVQFDIQKQLYDFSKHISDFLWNTASLIYVVFRMLEENQWNGTLIKVSLLFGEAPYYLCVCSLHLSKLLLTDTFTQVCTLHRLVYCVHDTLHKVWFVAWQDENDI